MIMRRSVKALLVCIGWIVVCIVSFTLVNPIIESFIRSDGLIPIEYAIPALIMAVGVGVPIMYCTIFLITPLFMATLEVLDDGV